MTLPPYYQGHVGPPPDWNADDARDRVQRRAEKIAVWHRYINHHKPNWTYGQVARAATWLTNRRSP